MEDLDMRTVAVSSVDYGVSLGRWYDYRYVYYAVIGSPECREFDSAGLSGTIRRFPSRGGALVSMNSMEVGSLSQARRSATRGKEGTTVRTQR